MSNTVRTPNSDVLDECIANLIECYTELLILETSIGNKELKRKLKDKLRYQANNIKELGDRI